VKRSGLVGLDSALDKFGSYWVQIPARISFGKEDFFLDANSPAWMILGGMDEL
jgi:hypothetical protein